jgi:hypothetical protein
VGNDRRKTAAKQITNRLRSFIEGPLGIRGAYVRTEIFYAKTVRKKYLYGSEIRMRV